MAQPEQEPKKYLDITVAAILIIIAAGGGYLIGSGRYVLPSPRQGALIISGISPTAGPVGTEVTVRGSGFLQEGNAIRFEPVAGDLTGGYLNFLSSPDGKTLAFVVPDGLDICEMTTSGIACQGFTQLMPGTYNLSVVNENGFSNSVTFDVAGFPLGPGPEIRGGICTQEAKLCPDGSAVGRNPTLNCEFDPCPTL